MNENDNNRRWLLIGGGIIAVVVVLILLFLFFGRGGPGTAPPPTAVGITSPIVGPVWEWTGTTDSSGKTTTVGNPSQYTIQFQTAGDYKGQADCNSISGTYVVNGSSLQINPGVSTLVGCPAGSLADLYTTQLFAAASYFMQGTELTINLKADTGNMHFRQQGAPSNASVLIGPVWRWHQTQYNNGSNQVVPDPNQYTLEFGKDRRVQIKADCNNGSGVYTTSANNALTIQIQQQTRAACPPGSLADQYVQQLESTDSFFTGGSDLVLNIQNNNAKMMFGSGVFPTVGPPVTIMTVTPAPSGVPATATITNTPSPLCPGPPTIQFFIAENPTLQKGQNTVLRWGQVQNATGVAIDQEVGGVAAPGSTIVSPNVTTIYTMTATGCGGTTQAAVSVTVIEPTTQRPTAQPPTAQLPTAAPTQVLPTAEPTQLPPTTQPTLEPQPTEQPGAALLGLWRWTGTRLQGGASTSVPNPNQYTINFRADGTAPIQADCNQATATWSVSGSQLSIVIGATTNALCGPESLSDQYLQWLGQANTYSAQGSNLTIVLKQDSGQMSFTH